MTLAHIIVYGVLAAGAIWIVVGKPDGHQVAIVCMAPFVFGWALSAYGVNVLGALDWLLAALLRGQP